MIYPPAGILSPAESTAVAAVVDTEAVQDVLTRVGVGVVGVEATIAPQIVSYAIELDRAADPKKVERAVDSLTLALHSPVRYAGVEAGRVIVEANRTERAAVPLAGLTSQHPGLRVPFGTLTDGSRLAFNVSDLPHLLIAGTTGSGKSTFLTSLLTSLLLQNTPEQLRLVLIDPKKVELATFADAPHLLGDVVTNAGEAASALRRMVSMMEQRYELLKDAGVQDLAGYNMLHKDKALPRVVVVVDELASLMLTSRAAVEEVVARLAGEGRAAGIHLVLATQRPDRKTFTPLILSNIAPRVVFAVQSHHDSIVALGRTGAERLGGGGDGLFVSPKALGKAQRFQSAYVSADDARRVVAWWRRERPVEVAPAPVEVVEEDTDAGQAALRAELDALLPAKSKGDDVTSGATPDEVLDACGITPEVVDALAESLSERIGAGVLEYINRAMGEQR